MRAALLEGRGMATMTSPALSQYWALGPVLLSPIPDPSSNMAHGDSADQALQCTLHLMRPGRSSFPLFMIAGGQVAVQVCCHCLCKQDPLVIPGGFTGYRNLSTFQAMNHLGTI